MHALSQASTALRSGAVTSEALVRQALSRKTAAISAKLNCFMDDSETYDTILQLARESDGRRSRGGALGPLDGIPFTVKDNFCVAGSVTSAASNILATFRSPYTSHCVSNLLQQGAVLIGRTNMDEFGMGSASAFSRKGAVVNPYSPRVATHGKDSEELTAGGSSGGGAAAVAWGAGSFAVGSDTGGSVRQPAAFCGVVGFKPSYGYISRHGLVAYASSLDCPGVMAATVGDAALAVACMGASGVDTDDRYAKHINRLDVTAEMSLDLKGVVVGVPEEYNLPELDAGTVSTWKLGLQWLEDAGATVKAVSLPSTNLALPTYYTIAPAEASSNLSRYDGVRYGQQGATVDPHASFHELYTSTRSQGFGREVQRRIMIGGFVLSESQRSEFFDAALQARKLITREYDAVFQSGVTVLVTPTSPTLPWPVLNTHDVNPVDMYANDVMTVPASLAGVPALSLPVAYSKGATPLPLALQVIGGRYREGDVVRVGAALERCANFRAKLPPYLHP